MILITRYGFSGPDKTGYAGHRRLSGNSTYPKLILLAHDGALEGDLNPAYISAFAALAGAIIGGLTSFATSWLTQRAQLRHAHREAERAELKTLYDAFIAEASRLFIEALTNKTDDMDDITGLVRLYEMVGRMHLVSDRTVIAEAMRTAATILETYLGPDYTVRELMDQARQGKISFLVEFSEACRKDLAARATTIR
jgi:hypothetical protein